MTIKCVLVGIINNENTDDELRELEALVESSGGLEVVGRITQRRAQPEPHYYLGKGKLNTLRELITGLGAELVVCDDELTPAQQRNMARALETSVTDRTGIILDIFAQRAHTAEGKVQVELARLKYLLPRLVGKGTELSRLGGGIGTRGPGETKLETDRRKVRQRIHELEKEIELLTRRQLITRHRRAQMEIPLVSLVGYTNAGKSSIMGNLTGTEAGADPRLFATLETTGHRIDFPEGGHFVLTDTVGFINKLPHQLVASFRATLMEVREADLILHVVDVSTPGVEERIRTVEKVLAEIDDRPRLELKVYNKMDLLSPEEIGSLGLDLPEGQMVSARSGQGMSELLQRIQRLLFGDATEITVNIPYNRGDLINLLYDNSHVREREDLPAGVIMRVRGTGLVLGRVLQAMDGEIDNE
jgi:GTP-binding protein HflX